MASFPGQPRKPAPRSRQITTPTHRHSFLQVVCSSWRPTEKALKALTEVLASSSSCMFTVTVLAYSHLGAFHCNCTYGRLRRRLQWARASGYKPWSSGRIQTSPSTTPQLTRSWTTVANKAIVDIRLRPSLVLTPGESVWVNAGLPGLCWPLLSQFEYTPSSCRLFLAIIRKYDVIHKTGSTQRIATPPQNRITVTMHKNLVHIRRV